jgi:hypothetical protein
VIYAIPSRARAKTLIAKTLPLLDRLGIPERDRRVFVSAPEIAEYRLVLDDAGYEEVRVEPGALGVCGNRNAMTHHFAEGERYVSIDDDLRDLRVMVDEKTLRPITPEEWAEVVATGWEMLDETGARLWGLYPVPNPYFMRRRISTRLVYVAGAVWGIENRRDAHLVDLEYRDDWQRSVQCYVADGAVIRFDYVTWSTEGYHGAGGLQTTGERTPDATLRDCEELVRRHPGLVTLNLTKKSGWPETRLRDRRAAGQATLS